MNSLRVTRFCLVKGRHVAISFEPYEDGVRGRVTRRGRLIERLVLMHPDLKHTVEGAEALMKELEADERLFKVEV